MTFRASLMRLSGLVGSSVVVVESCEEALWRLLPCFAAVRVQNNR